MYPTKKAVEPPFSNFSSDHAKVLVFGHNNFSCSANNLKNSICLPLAFYPAKMAVKPPFNFFSGQARVLVFGHNNSSCGANNLGSPT